MTITILTYDPCWKGLAPTVKRAATAAILAEAAGLASSPLEGEPNPSSDLVGGKKVKQTRNSQFEVQSAPPHQNAEGAFWLPLEGGAGSPVRPVEFFTKLSVTIVLSTDAEIRTLNQNYRGKNKPTNVLSFPDGSIEGGTKQLGDIILAYETIAREASEQGKILKHHLTHLTIHGVLHLLGYDHESESDAEKMESREIAILATMGVANPYESA